MYNLRVVSDLDECQEIWHRAVPQQVVSDLWGVRACFHRRFRRPAHFVVAEDGDGLVAALPLSWIEEAGCYGYFPGETWQGKTWLEQNRVPDGGDGLLEAMLQQCPGRYHLRYLLPLVPQPQNLHVLDEVGYLFQPPSYGYDMENYFLQFSHKSAKRIKQEISLLEDRHPLYRHDDVSDFDQLVRLSLGSFGDSSYFADDRFREGFRDLMGLLNEKGWLRMTAVIIGGDVAAVDMGCVYRGAYTLLAGGTNRSYPGVAKLINLHHMRRGCQERLDVVDFLCGDFSWKKLFHLAPRPLYLLSTCSCVAHPPEGVELGSPGHVG